MSLPYCAIGPFTWHNGFKSIINQYDVVVFPPYLRMVRVAIMPLLPHKPKLISWSIGVHASYTRPYDLSRKPDFKDRLSQSIQNHSDACIFYMPEPIEYWKKYGSIDEEKYFVAHNTVEIAPLTTTELGPRTFILFVGTLYKQKGVEELIKCYALAKGKVGDLPPLMIIGDGPEKRNIKRLIISLDLEDDVVLEGAIFDEIILKDFFSEAILCISPKQAGLTVLKSFGYGVPFVTRRDAITGGEKSNIKDGVNGYFYDTEEELINIIVRTKTHPEEFMIMSDAARNHYLTEASPEAMAQGVIDAIMYVLKN